MEASPSTRARILALASALVGASISALLWLQTSSGASACGLSGGCDVVQASSWSRVFGVPLAVWGTLYFTAVGAVLLGAGERWPRALRGVAAAGGIGGAALLASQLFVLKAICPWCVCVDLAAIALAITAVRGRALLGDASKARPWRTASIVLSTGLAPVAVLSLWLLPAADPPPAPIPAAALPPTTEDGVATIVEFVDIECPFCREQHQRLAKILDAVGRDRVEVEVHHLPIPSHEHARDAAAVACCGEEQGRGGAVLDALMAADDLSPAGCRRAAASAGADLGSLDACLASDRLDPRLDADRSAAQAVGVRALPTCVIGGERLEGLQEVDDLRSAIDTALADSEPASDCST